MYHRSQPIIDLATFIVNPWNHRPQPLPQHHRRRRLSQVSQVSQAKWHFYPVPIFHFLSPLSIFHKK